MTHVYYLSKYTCMYTGKYTQFILVRAQIKFPCNIWMIKKIWINADILNRKEEF